MKARVTNAWSDVYQPPEEREPAVTRVVLESTVPPADYRLYRPFPTRCTLELKGLSLNMPAGGFPVWDGLVAEFRVTEAAPDSVRMDVFLEHPAAALVSVQEGLPARTVVSLERGVISHIMAGRVVAVDPGHGGTDTGARGPINLVEKDIVLDVARRLAKRLSATGATPVLIREGDDVVSPAERTRRAAATGAACLVSIHTGHAARPAVAGTRTLFRPGAAGDQELAALLHRGVLRKIRRPDRGVAPDERVLPATLPCPAARVEAVCLTNPLEEAWLRSPVFRDRLAQGLFNGIKDYFHAGEEARPLPPSLVTSGPVAQDR